MLFSTNPSEISDFSAYTSRDIMGNLLKDLDENRERLRARSEQLDTQNALQINEAEEFVSGVLNQRQNTIMPQPQQDIGLEMDYNDPVVQTQQSQPQIGGGKDPVDFIFNSEARRDKSGRLQVYVPPSGDGGGSFEVAGITAKYQPKESAQLRSLIQQGKHDEAEAYAKDFYRKRAAPFTKYTDKAGIQLQLADTVHHRGEGGLRRVLQRATGSKSKSYSDLISQLNEDPQALDKFNQARVDYEMHEVDRGRASRAKFRKGLLNRFRNADIAARQF